MTRTVALQMDPVADIDIKGDSSFVLGLEAQKRGYQLYHYQPGALSFQNGTVSAHAEEMTLRPEEGNHFDCGPRVKINLAHMDVILMRQDPPFDMSYITATHLLDHIHPETLVVNNPASVRNAPEKLLVTHFSHLMPETLITRNQGEIRAFREEYKDIIVKPLFGNGGAGVFHLKPGDENLSALLEMFFEKTREPLMIQRFMPEVRGGDKRIILVDGKAVGALNRIPVAGEARSNMHVGGTPVKSELTRRDHEICEIIGPTLREQGLIFAGIDVIGDYLTEINVTSPTGLQEINRYDDTCLEAMIWDAIEEKL